MGVFLSQTTFYSIIFLCFLSKCAVLALLNWPCPEHPNSGVQLTSLYCLQQRGYIALAF
jgi:hypothetical protein